MSKMLAEEVHSSGTPTQAPGVLAKIETLFPALRCSGRSPIPISFAEQLHLREKGNRLLVFGRIGSSGSLTPPVQYQLEGASHGESPTALKSLSWTAEISGSPPETARVYWRALLAPSSWGLRFAPNRGVSELCEARLIRSVKNYRREEA